MINEVLLKLHNEPIDIYEEQKRLKDHLLISRKKKIESLKSKSVRSLVKEQHELQSTLIQRYHSFIKKREETIEKLNVELIDYLQKKERYQASLPSSHETIHLLDELIISTQRSIEELSANTFDLKQQLLSIETEELTPLKKFHTDLTPAEYYATAYEAVHQLRESASASSQAATYTEQYNLEIKKDVEIYKHIVEMLNNDPSEITLQTLMLAFERVAKSHAEVAEDYLDLFDEISVSLPNMLHEFADALQYQIDSLIKIDQTIDDIKDLHEQKNDRTIVENMLNGSIGKYMEGDISFINYLNSRGELAIYDIKHVSKEVELGKAKDRGVNYIVNLMEQNHGITLPFHDAFKLRLLLIEHHKVIEVSTKNNKVDYTKNYLNQHTSLSAKALATGATISPPLRNHADLKNLIYDVLKQYAGDNGYARDAMIELLDNGISRLPKNFSSK